MEAYLNYLEAYYLRNGKVDGKAANTGPLSANVAEWTQLRKTIRNTDMSKVDWAKYSGSTLVDATLFNIRRERRCEFIGEGMRWDDLMRWRAMDQLLTTKYIPEGFNFWDEAYDDYVAMKNDKGEPKYKIVSDGSSTANMSAKEWVNMYVRTQSSKQTTLYLTVIHSLRHTTCIRYRYGKWSFCLRTVQSTILCFTRIHTGQSKTSEPAIE